MKRFVVGQKEQFVHLDNELNDGKCHVFLGCQLPICCTPKTARIGFEKSTDAYIMYIDKNISANTEHSDFKTFLEAGIKKFTSLDDMIEFCHSLKTLFDDNINRDDDSNKQIKNLENIVDLEGLHELELEAQKGKMVWPEDIANPLKEKIFGQDEVIDQLAEKIVINKIRKEPTILTIALLGPTATGKSETAKSLAKILSDLYDVEYGFIEVAASEFVGEHSVNRFLGAPPSYVGYGSDTILEPIRSNPYHVVVMNEIEKANQQLLVSLMEAIDTGFLGMADNSQPIDLNHSIILFTSNISIDVEKYKKASDFEKCEICRDAFTKHCGRPEISGKIGNFLLFNPLENDANTKIIIKFIYEELNNYELTLNHIDKHLLFDFKKYNTKYGARGIRDLVSSVLGKHLLHTRKYEELKGKKINMLGSIDNIKFEICEGV